jgi:hypothetical protein
MGGGSGLREGRRRVIREVKCCWLGLGSGKAGNRGIEGW